MAYYAPFKGDGSPRTIHNEYSVKGKGAEKAEKLAELQAKNIEMFFKYAELLRDAAVPLAQYETPKLSAIAVAPAPDTTKQQITMTVAIFDSHDREIARVVDGREVPLIEHRSKEEDEERT
jgi:hypothetical protein